MHRAFVAWLCTLSTVAVAPRIFLIADVEAGPISEFGLQAQVGVAYQL